MTNAAVSLPATAGVPHPHSAAFWLEALCRVAAPTADETLAIVAALMAVWEQTSRHRMNEAD